MKLIVGLGNPGGKFKYTRHNIGFMVIEKLAKSLLPVGKSEKAWVSEKKFESEMCKVDKDILLVKPQTYMNRSGIAVLKLINYYKLSPADLWVVHDDIDLPLGKIRIRMGGASAGHQGIESFIRELGDSEFVRFRLGIGRGKLDIKKTTDINMHRRDVKDFVISPFQDKEAGEMKKLIKYATEALNIALKKGIESSMNRFN